MQNHIWDKIVKIAAAVAGAVVGALGGCDGMLRVLLAFMVIDYACGWIVAWMGKSPKTEGGKLDSRVGFIGIARKGLMLLVVWIAVMLDSAAADMGMADTSLFRSLIICYYIANEGLSIIENLNLAGVPFPQWLRNALEQLRDRSEKMPTTADKPPDGEHK